MHRQGLPLRSWLCLLAGPLLLLGGCAIQIPGTASTPAWSTPQAASGPLVLGSGAAGSYAPTGAGSPTQAPAGHGIAILAPLSGPLSDRGDALVKAAQLALASPGSPALDVRDTGGTPEGAAGAAQAAIAAGAGLIIGPLTAPETAAVAGPAHAAGVPVLAFTSDASRAQAGVWTLGITPLQQVRRLVGAVTSEGKTRFAALLPDTQFGQAMGNALNQTASAAGASAAVHYHPAGNAAIAESMRDISDYAGRRGPIDAQIKAARSAHTAEGRAKAEELSRQGVPPAPFDALLLADTGSTLAWLSTFIPYYDMGPPGVRVLGPALWAEPSARAGATLAGAWYAAPNPDSRSAFVEGYQTKYGTTPPGLADLAFDAASMGRVLALSGGYSIASICRPDGFLGVDGLLGLAPDGSVRRGLAVFEIGGGGTSVIQPAPTSLSAPGV